MASPLCVREQQQQQPIQHLETVDADRSVRKRPRETTTFFQLTRPLLHGLDTSKLSIDSLTRIIISIQRLILLVPPHTRVLLRRVPVRLDLRPSIGGVLHLHPVPAPAMPVSQQQRRVDRRRERQWVLLQRRQAAAAAEVRSAVPSKAVEDRGGEDGGREAEAEIRDGADWCVRVTVGGRSR